MTKVRVVARATNSRRATVEMFLRVGRVVGSLVCLHPGRCQSPLRGSRRPDALDEDVLDRWRSDLEAGHVRVALEGLTQDRLGIGVIAQLDLVVVEARPTDGRVGQCLEPIEVPIARDAEADDDPACLPLHARDRAQRITRPRSMIVIASHSSSTASIWCVLKTMALPRSRSRGRLP